jgi:restriction endonuclease S subunit
VNTVGLRAEHSAFFFANFLAAYSNIIAANANHATLPIFNQTQTRNFLVAVPPSAEQVEIVEFIRREETRFDRLLSAYARQLELLREYRAALIHECVTGQRRYDRLALTSATLHYAPK